MELDRIYNEDCFEGMKRIPDETIDAVIADPPYCVGMSSNSTKSSTFDLSIIKPFYRELYRELARVLKPDGWCYVFTDWRTYPIMYDAANSHLNQRNLIVWNKRNPTAGSWYLYSHELIVFCVKGTAGYRKFTHNHFDMITVPKLPTNNRWHTAQKPEALISQLILDSTSEGETILDPFMCTGTMAVCCRELKRHYIGFEIDPANYEKGQKRLELDDQNVRLGF